LKSGGVAGLSRKINIDTNFLPSSEAQEIDSVIDSSKFFDLPSSTAQSNSGSGDYFRYKITLESHSENKHTVKTTEITMPSELSPFIEYLRRKIKERNR
jgi:hypothetical protein